MIGVKEEHVMVEEGGGSALLMYDNLWPDNYPSR